MRGEGVTEGGRDSEREGGRSIIHLDVDVGNCQLYSESVYL